MNWIDAAPIALVTIAWVLVPGLGISYLLGLRGIAAWGLAPVSSIALIAATAVLAEKLGIDWSPGIALIVCAAAAVVVGGVAFLLRRKAFLASAPDPRRLTLIAALGMLPALVLGLATVVQAIGAPDRLSQTYDAVFHYNALAFINDSHQASSLTLGSLGNPDVAGVFYPAAWHDVASLVMMSTGTGIPLAANAVTVVAAVVLWPLSCLLLVRQLFGRNAGALAITGALSVGFTAFPWDLLGFGVLWPNLLGMAFAPAFLAVVLTLTGWVRDDAIGVGPRLARAARLPAGGRVRASERAVLGGRARGVPGRRTAGDAGLAAARGRQARAGRGRGLRVPRVPRGGLVLVGHDAGVREHPLAVLGPVRDAGQRGRRRRAERDPQARGAVAAVDRGVPRDLRGAPDAGAAADRRGPPRHHVPVRADRRDQPAGHAEVHRLLVQRRAPPRGHAADHRRAARGRRHPVPGRQGPRRRPVRRRHPGLAAAARPHAGDRVSDRARGRAHAAAGGRDEGALPRRPVRPGGHRLRTAGAGRAGHRRHAHVLRQDRGRDPGGLGRRRQPVRGQLDAVGARGPQGAVPALPRHVHAGAGHDRPAPRRPDPRPGGVRGGRPTCTSTTC